MSQKRACEHQSVGEAKKRPKKTHGAVMTVGDDLYEEDSTPDSSSTQSTMMNRLEDYVRVGNQTAVRQLLAQETVDLKSPEGGDLLWTAYALDMPGMVAMLVHYGADLSVRKHLDNRTLLHHMLRGSRIESVVTRNLVSLMLDFGADVDARDNEGISLLHDAITSSHQGSTELVKELLKRGAEITVNKEDRHMDDVCATCMQKLDLLPMLILHQEPDEKTRNQRASIAIECLIAEKYEDDQRAAPLLMIEKILGLGVPVNIPNSQSGKEKMSFLDTALWHQNIAVVELLLKCGADPHQQNFMGQTALYQATAFKETTQVSRWFIDRGVSIEARNFHGDYPIHGACKNESVKNVRLLLELGADLNSTDSFGKTPFGEMKMKKKRSDAQAHELIIKYLALTIARGVNISEKDRAKIKRRGWSKKFFENCIKQLKEMKIKTMYGVGSYFSLLSLNTYSMLQLVKCQTFVVNFKRDRKNRAVLFPDYCGMILHSFKVAEKKVEVLLEEKKELRKVFMGTLPDSVLEKISYYLSFDKLKQCHRDYFITLHAANDLKIKKVRKMTK